MAAANQGRPPTVLDILQRNDPRGDTIFIDLDGKLTDEALAQALAENPPITRIMMNFCHRHQHLRWPALYHVISTRENLTRIFLRDSFAAAHYRCSVSVTTAALKAIQQNSNITVVGLKIMNLSGQAVANLIDNAASLKRFELGNPDIELSEVVLITDALNRSTSVETLRLVRIKHSLLLRILAGISPKAGSSLATLKVELSDEDEIEQDWHSIYHAAAKIRVETLSFENHVTFPGPQFTAMIAAIPHIQAKNIKLSTIGCNGTEVDGARTQILKAAKLNFGLCHLDGRYRVVGGRFQTLFDWDNARLKFIYDRNESFAEWQNNPNTLPQELWYEAFVLSLQAGPESVFRGLLNAASEGFFGSFLEDPFFDCEQLSDCEPNMP